MIASTEIDRALRVLVEKLTTETDDAGATIQAFAATHELDLQTTATLYRIASGEATDLAAYGTRQSTLRSGQPE